MAHPREAAIVKGAKFKRTHYPLPALKFTLREAAVRRGYRGGEFCKREGRELVKLLCDGSDKRDKRAEDDNGLKTDRADDPFQ
jgi:hypothetical protein